MNRFAIAQSNYDNSNPYEPPYYYAPPKKLCGCDDDECLCEELEEIETFKQWDIL